MQKKIGLFNIKHAMFNCPFCILQENKGLLDLNVAMNGFGNSGAFAFGKSLKENSTLLELDLSSNRINIEGVILLSKGE